MRRLLLALGAVSVLAGVFQADVKHNWPRAHGNYLLGIALILLSRRNHAIRD